MPDSLKPGLGNWVDDDRFFNRERELPLFGQKLLDGASVLLVAQRRIGKTSLMRESSRRLKDKIIALHVDLEKAFTAEDAVVELSLATRVHDKIWTRISSVFGSALETTLSRLDSIQVTGVSVKLRGELNQQNWRSLGDRIFATLASVSEKEGKQVVIFFDEVPILVSRILKGADGSISAERKASTDAFMSWLRDNVLRHRGRVSQVLTGSIGIEPLLNQAGLSGTLNAYWPFELRPWSTETAVRCILALAKDRGVDLNEQSAKHMVALLGCAIPHHVQMFFDHVYSHHMLSESGDPITPELVDAVYEDSMTGLRGHPELSHMEERLKLVFSASHFAVALRLLTETAVVGTLSAEGAEAICSGSGVEDSRHALLEIIHILEHDGYLQREGASFRFVSRLVRDWWKRRFGFGYKPLHESK